MIYLTCPGCSAELELDDGFRGGVCRCSQCKTMMTVPDDPDHEEAEKLERPAAPGARPSTPGTRPSAPGGRPDSPGGRPDAPSRPGVPGANKTETEDEDFKVKIVEKGESLEQQVFITPSGKQVTLTADDFAKVPSAPKRRMGIRVTIIAMFIVVCLVLTGLLVGAFVIVLNMNSNDNGGGDDIYWEVMGPQKNAFNYEKPNILGWEISPEGERILIVVDLSRSMNDSKIYVLKSLENSLKSMELAKPGYTVQFAFMDKEKPLYYPSTARGPELINKKELIEKYENMPANSNFHMKEVLSNAISKDFDAVYFIAAIRGGSTVKKDFEEMLPRLKEQKLKIVSIWMMGRNKTKTPDYLVEYQKAYWQEQGNTDPFEPKETALGDFTRFEAEIVVPANP